MSDTKQPWTPSIEARLELLRAELQKTSEEYVHLALPESPVECHLGVESGGASWIMVTCDPKGVTTDNLSAAVDFVVRPTGYRVRVSGNAPRSVSAHFLAEVVQLLKDGHAPGDAGRAALQRWRELLAKPPGSPLSDKALAGLFGELEVLTGVLKLGGGLDHWTGWMGDHCDFRMPVLVVEVKSTTSPNYRRVQIHGLAQLADPEDGSRLVLVLRRLELSPEGKSVPALTDDLVKLGAPRSVLLDRLSNVGYSEVHRAAYENTKFVSREVALRQIDDSHPRLIPSMLEGVDLSCIDKIDYELNLNGTPDADLDVSLEDLIRGSLA